MTHTINWMHASYGFIRISGGINRDFRLETDPEVFKLEEGLATFALEGLG